jgi:hypothetical protein
MNTNCLGRLVQLGNVVAGRSEGLSREWIVWCITKQYTVCRGWKPELACHVVNDGADEELACYPLKPLPGAESEPESESELGCGPASLAQG